MIIIIVIVIAVIAILAAVLIPTFSNVVEKAQDSAFKQNAANEYKVALADALEDGVVENYVEAVEGCPDGCSEVHDHIDAKPASGDKGFTVAADGKNYKIKYTKIFKLNI